MRPIFFLWVRERGEVEKGEKSYKIKFQNGAINRNNAVKAAGAGMVFQFQIGSINSLYLKSRFLLGRMFQFQFGSINRHRR